MMSDPLEGELQTVVSCHVGAGNAVQALLPLRSVVQSPCRHRACLEQEALRAQEAVTGHGGRVQAALGSRMSLKRVLGDPKS